MGNYEFDTTQFFREIASGESRTDGKEKITTDEIIETYPDGITIYGIEKKQSLDGDVYWAFLFTEDLGKFFYGGKTLAEIAEKMFEAFQNNSQLVNKILQENPVKIKMQKVRTKKGGLFTRIVVVNNPHESEKAGRADG